MSEGMTPNQRKNKERLMAKHFQEAKRSFDAELRRRGEAMQMRGGLRPFAPVSPRYQAERENAWRRWRDSNEADYAEDVGLDEVAAIPGATFKDFGSGAEPRKREQTNWAAVKPLVGSGIETRTLAAWDPAAVVCFSGRTHWLSNFHRDVPVYIDGHQYHTLEHYYQACKLFMLGGAHLSNRVRGVPDAGNVKVLTKRLLLDSGVPAWALEEWGVKEGPRLLEYGLMHKFVQSKEWREKLMETGEAFLAQTYDRDAIFAVGCKEEEFMEWVRSVEGEEAQIPNALSPETIPYFPHFGKGKNLLGLIAMRVRDAIRGNLSRIEGMEAAVEEAAGDVAKRKELAENVTEAVLQKDPVLARALASIATKPADDTALLQRLRELRAKKEKEKAEKFAEREAARAKAKADAAEAEQRLANISLGAEPAKEEKKAKKKKDKK